MSPDPTMSESENVRSLLEETLQLARKIHASTEKTRRYIVWGQIIGAIKLLIILVPLVVGFIFIKPYLQSAFGAYQDLLGLSAGSQGATADGQGNTSTLQQLQNAGALKGLSPKQIQDLQKYLK